MIPEAPAGSTLNCPSVIGEFNLTESGSLLLYKHMEEKVKAARSPLLWRIIQISLKEFAWRMRGIRPSLIS